MESTQSLNRRMDSDDWQRIKPLLSAGGTLVYHPGLQRYYTKFKDEFGQYGLSRTKVRNLEDAGEIMQVGVQTYGLAQS